MFDISPVNTNFEPLIQAKIDGKTKPLGALGQLESLAKQIALIQLSTNSDSAANINTFTLALTKPHMSVFAGDHGVAEQGVSIAPSEVTGQMLANFAQGGAAINVFCRQLGWHLNVIDAGTLVAQDAKLGIIDQRLGNITAPFNRQAAMTKTQVDNGFLYAKAHVKRIAESGCNIIGFGEMGIGNTTTAAAIMAAVMNIPAKEVVGKGTGVTDEVVDIKRAIVEQALILHQSNFNDVKEILRTIGGFEIVQLVAAMLAAAEQKMIILVDGFICTAAAMLATKCNLHVKDYMIFAHCSGEQGHQKMLDWLEVKPILQLGMRLGEGSGAALSLPVIEAAVNFYNEMASFEQANVTNVV